MPGAWPGSCRTPPYCHKTRRRDPSLHGRSDIRILGTYSRVHHVHGRGRCCDSLTWPLFLPFQRYWVEEPVDPSLNRLYVPRHRPATLTVLPSARVASVLVSLTTSSWERMRYPVSAVQRPDGWNMQPSPTAQSRLSYVVLRFPHRPKTPYGRPPRNPTETALRSSWRYL